jgi:hypothetical protein
MLTLMTPLENVHATLPINSRANFKEKSGLAISLILSVTS